MNNRPSESFREDAARWASIDQFRGYAIVGMIFVNYIGEFAAAPWILKHHRTGMSYNDTIAPLFIFAAGMGFRLSMMRQIALRGLAHARGKAARRYLTLTAIGGVLYMGYFWDALTDIGIAGLLTLFLMDKGPVARVFAAFLLLLVYQGVFSCCGYGAWVLSHSLNGGPLGPLSWAFILLMGSLAGDWYRRGNRRTLVWMCAFWGLGLCLAGWALRAPWPGLKADWPFTQYGMSAPYCLFSTGLCFWTLLGFHILCDRHGIRVPHLTAFGRNPLVLYLFLSALLLVARAVLPETASWRVIAVGFCVLYAACYALAWGLFRRNIIVKL